MANYIGNEPRSFSNQRDYFAGTGSQTIYTLSYAPGGAFGIIVAISGLIQKPSVAYYVSGKTLTFTEAPPVPAPGETNNIEIIYLQRTGVTPTLNWKAPVASNTGTTDALTASFSPAFASLTNNMLAYVVVPSANTTTTPTLSVDGLPAKLIVGIDGTTIKIGALLGTILVRYDLGTDHWWIVNTSINSNVTTRGTLAGASVTPNVDIYASWSWGMSANSTLNFPAGTIPASGAWYIDITVDATGGYSLTFGSGYNKVYGFYFDCLPNAMYRLWLVSRNSTIVDVNIERIA